MSGIHSSIAPSSIYLTCECPGSVNVCAGLPADEETPESIEGDVAHWVALQLALGVVVPVGTERKGIKVDIDMLDGARLWIDNISSGGAHEVPIWIPDIHENCWGTADHWEWDESILTLDVEDYKYGHLYVEIFENKQLLSYASGVLRAVNAPDNAVVRLKVVQPRCYIDNQVRTWTTTAANVRRLVAEMAEKVRIATDPNIPALCRTGSHCTYCPGRSRCTTLQMASNQVMNFSHHADSVDLQPNIIGVEMQLIKEAIKLLEARKSGLAVRAEAYIKEGKRVPNWEMKNGRSNLAWNDNQAAIREGDAAGVNLRKEIVPITPTQAKERKLLDVATVDRLASRPTPAQKLSFISQFSIRKVLSGECS
jgi:hypothetical protein